MTKGEITALRRQVAGDMHRDTKFATVLEEGIQTLQYGETHFTIERIIRLSYELGQRDKEREIIGRGS